MIVNYETSRLLSRCLAAVEEACRTSRDLTVETIVVDNGSRDDSVRCAQQSSLGPRVISLIRNRGFAAAVNCGLRARRGRHVLLLNSDVKIDRTLLSHGVQILDGTDSAGVLGAALFHPDGRPQRSIHALPDLVSELVPGPILFFFRPQAFNVWRGRSVADEHAPPREVEAVRGAVFFIQGETLKKVGLLNEDYFFFLEETDYCWRVRTAGKQVLHCESLRAAHRLGASSKRRAALATRIEYHRSLYHFLDRRRGRGISTVVRVARVLRTVVSLAVLLCLAIGSPVSRRRMAERWGLLVWHLQGRPKLGGLAEALLADDPLSILTSD